jgi:hypothetical protein
MFVLSFYCKYFIHFIWHWYFTGIVQVVDNYCGLLALYCLATVGLYTLIEFFYYCLIRIVKRQL